MRIKTYLTLVCLSFCAWTVSYSQTTQYDGPDGGDWLTESNWTNGLPSTGKDALIGGGHTVIISSSLTIDFTITNFGIVTANAPITNNGTISNSGTFDFSTNSGLANKGTFNNFGNSSMIGSATFVNEPGATFTNIGTFNISTVLTNKGQATNNGTINAEAGTLLSEGAFDNSQSLTTESLTVVAGSTFTNNFGSFLIITGATPLLQIDGSFNNLGNVEAGGTFNVTGNFSNSSLVLVTTSLKVFPGAIFNNNNGTVTNEGTSLNEGTFINGYQFINKGGLSNKGIFNNNNLIDNQPGGNFTSEAGGTIGMGFGSKIKNSGTFTTKGALDSFGNIENSGNFSNQGTINSFSGSQINNLVGSFTNAGTMSTNDKVNNDALFFNNGVINVNGGSVWKNNADFTNSTTGHVNNVQDFQNYTNLINNGRFTNLVRILNEGTFANNAYLENVGIFTNEAGGTLNNNELLQQSSGKFLNKGVLKNTNLVVSDECSSFANDGSIQNNGKLEVHAILFQRGSLTGTAVDCQGCYIHTGATSDAPSICQDGTFGTDINGDVKVYAPALVAFENFDSCSSLVYLADGLARPVFACSDIGTTINVHLVVRVPNTNDSLTCTAIVTPKDELEPQFDNCPKDIIIFTDKAGVAVDWTEPSFLDNCTSTDVVASHEPGDVFPIGITGVTYTGTDNYGNVNNCQFRVDVRQTPPGGTCTGDGAGPQFVGCPNNITLTTTGSDAKATWVAPLASDNCYPIFINSDFVPGQRFGVGKTTVIYTAKDGNNNESTCTFDITVQTEDPCAVDNTPPSFINCPTNIYKPTNAITGGAVAIWASPNVFDLCGVASVTSSHNPGSVFPAGTTQVVYTADDVNGNSSTCKFSVTVGNDPCPEFTTPPVFTNCPADISVQVNGNSSAVSWTPPTANSSCKPITINSNYSPGTVFQLGQTLVQYQASDIKGNSSVCSFRVTVSGNCTSDNVPPVISNCPANITVPGNNGSGQATWTPPTATDNCGLVSFSSTFLPGAMFPVGVTTVIYSAGDVSGNGSTCEFNVAVVNAPSCTSNAAPINLTTNVDPASVALSWNSSLNASGYDVFLGTTNPPTTKVATNVAGTSKTVTGLQGGTTYFWYVVPNNAAGSASGCASNTTRFSTTGGSASGGCNLKALFVASSTSLNTSDAASKTRLEALGFNVKVVSDNLVKTADANGMGLIFISSTTSSTYVNTKFRDVAVPVVCHESWLFDDLQMTGSWSGYDYDTESGQSKLVVQNTSHPMAAGLGGTTTVFTNNNDMTWGKPSSDAISIAYIPGSSSRKVIFGYEGGANMVGMKAPARRVGFFLYDSNSNLLTNNGVALFNAAVRWAAGIQAPGTACNDGNPNSENDVILADGCSCQGTICTGAITGMSFYNLNTGSTFISVANGGTYNLSDFPSSYNIEVATTGTLESVRFEISGALNDSHTENLVPYRYSGDTNPISLVPGNYTIVVTAYSQDQASGVPCDQQTFNFTITDKPPCAPVQLVCESNINNNGWTNHNDCKVVVCQGDKLILSVNPNGAQFSSMTGPNGYSATSSGGNDFLISNSVNQSHAGNYHVDLIDGNGCPGETVITVVVEGTPTAVCKNITVQLQAVGQSVQISGQQVDGGSKAGCNSSITSLNVSPSSFNQSGGFQTKLTVTNSFGLSSSCNATVTVLAPEGGDPTPCAGNPGTGLLREVWYGITDYDIANLTSKSSYPNSPDATFTNASSTGPSNFGNNYGTRVRGFITPSKSGDYKFYVTGDDQTDLYLSTDANPNNKSKIATIAGWTNENEFYKYSSQKSGSIYLQSGKSYYVELLHVEIGGGDHWGIHWVAPGASSPTKIPVQQLSPYDAGCNSASTSVLQTGKIVIEQAHSNAWYWVDFDKSFSKTPVVILGPPSANSTEQVIPRLRNVTKTGFEFQIDEWDYLNGYHPTETLYYIAMTPGNHTIGGKSVEAGSFTANHNWVTKSFNQSFDSTPAVLTTVASYNDANAVAPRAQNVGKSNFQFKLQEENGSSHANETIHYIAFKTGTFSYGGASFKAGITSDSVTDDWYTVNFGSNFSDPGFLASFHTYDGGDACALRHKDLNNSYVKIKVEEEQSDDWETSHTTEAVGWLVFSASTTLNLTAAVEDNIQLEAVKEEEFAILYWTHNKGQDVQEYILEKSVDGDVFVPIATVESEGTNRPELYENYDLEPATGENLYRVKLVHLDGTESYSATASVHYADLIDFVLFPNPANDFVKLNLEAIVGMENVNVAIYNNLGVLVDQVEIDKVYGKYYQLDLRKMKEGHYILWLNMPDRKPIAKQLVIGKL